MSIEGLTIRAIKKEELPFVYSTWLKSYKHSSPFAKRIRNDIYYKWHTRIIDHILMRAEVKVAVVEDVIYGYLVTEPGYIHFAYTKKPFRGMGIFSALYTTLPVTEELFFTHWTDAVGRMVERNTKLVYDPYNL